MFHSVMSCCLWRTKKNIVTLDGLKMELIPCWNTHVSRERMRHFILWSINTYSSSKMGTCNGVDEAGSSHWAHLILLPVEPASALTLSTVESRIPSSFAEKNYQAPFFPLQDPSVSTHTTQAKHRAENAGLSGEKCSQRCFQKQTELAPI